MFQFGRCLNNYIFTPGHENKGVMEGVRYGFLIGLFWLPVFV